MKTMSPSNSKDLQIKLEAWENGYHTAMDYVAKFGSQDTYIQLASLLRRYREQYTMKELGERETWCFTPKPPKVD